MGIFIQLIAVLLATIGFFGHIGILFIIGGIIGILLDTIGLLTGKLSPLFPIILYIGGYVLLGGWHGILWGAVIGSAIEVLFLIVALVGGGSYALFKNVKEK